MKKVTVIVIILLISNNLFAQEVSDCYKCSNEKLTTIDISSKSIDEISLIRNEIYARNGYRFKDWNLQEYFENKNWYKVLEDNNHVKLNKIEKENVVFLQKREKKLRKKRLALMNQLILFKKLVLSNDTLNLKKDFKINFFYSSIGDLKELLIRINLNDLNWYKNTGIYKVRVDNGFVEKVFSLRIDSKQVVLSYSFMSMSEIIEGFDVFSEYMSEDEYAIWWYFKFENGKLMLVNTESAG